MTFGTHSDNELLHTERKNASIMKTTKIIISIFVIALATTTSAQWNQLKDHLFNAHIDHHVIAYTDVRDDVIIRERMVAGLPHSNAYRTGLVEMIYEKEVALESWMTEAFDTGLENELQIEEWMTLPFSLADSEEELQLESWMSTPFTHPGQLKPAANLVADTWE
jgi:hypothetical protein